MLILGAIRLGLAIVNRLKNHKDRVALVEQLISAVGEDGKVTPVEWSLIGKTLGVFDTRDGGS